MFTAWFRNSFFVVVEIIQSDWLEKLSFRFSFLYGKSVLKLSEKHCVTYSYLAWLLRPTMYPHIEKIFFTFFFYDMQVLTAEQPNNILSSNSHEAESWINTNFSFVSLLFSNRLNNLSNRTNLLGHLVLFVWLFFLSFPASSFDNFLCHFFFNFFFCFVISRKYSCSYLYRWCVTLQIYSGWFFVFFWFCLYFVRFNRLKCSNSDFFYKLEKYNFCFLFAFFLLLLLVCCSISYDESFLTFKF